MKKITKIDQALSKRLIILEQVKEKNKQIEDIINAINLVKNIKNIEETKTTENEIDKEDTIRKSKEAINKRYEVTEEAQALKEMVGELMMTNTQEVDEEKYQHLDETTDINSYEHVKSAVAKIYNHDGMKDSMLLNTLTNLVDKLSDNQLKTEDDIQRLINVGEQAIEMEKDLVLQYAGETLSGNKLNEFIKEAAAINDRVLSESGFKTIENSKLKTRTK